MRKTQKLTLQSFHLYHQPTTYHTTYHATYHLPALNHQKLELKTTPLSKTFCTTTEDMTLRLPPKLIQRIFNILSQCIGNSIHCDNQVDTESLLALLKCSYASILFSIIAIPTIKKAVLIKTKEIAHAYADQLTALRSCGNSSGYHPNLLAVNAQDGLAPEDLGQIISQCGTINMIKLSWVHPSHLSAWLSCISAAISSGVQICATWKLSVEVLTSPNSNDV